MTSVTHTEWPARPWVMAVFLAVAGVSYHFAVDDLTSIVPYDRMRLALASFVCVGALSLAFTLEFLRWHWSVIFSMLAALVIASVAYWNGSSGGIYRFEPSWSLWSGLVAVMIAAPLLQTLRDEGHWKFDYEKLHNYSWADVVIFFTSLLFVGITFMLMHLLASLLNLIGLDFLKQLLQEEWFAWMLAGAAFGASLGILRESDHLLITLQNLVLSILSVLAPVLAVGLVLFLISLPLAGLETLWNSTRKTTPILLSCAIGAIILSNTIIRNREDEISNSRMLRISSVILAITVLPLTMLSAYSMWLRIHQYGMTPDRIWGFIVILIGVVYGLVYLLAVIKKRRNWSEFIRPMNIKLAGGLCLLAIFFALPFLDFGSLSAQSQLERFRNGRTSIDDFDYKAMAFDFGPAGRKILGEFAMSDDKSISLSSSEALAATNRWSVDAKINEGKSRAEIAKLIVLPEATSPPEELIVLLHQQAACSGEYCVLMWEPGSDKAILIRQHCIKQNSSCEAQTKYFKIHKKSWQEKYYNYDFSENRKEREARNIKIDSAIKLGDFSIREVKRRQFFAGDTPVGEVFE